MTTGRKALELAMTAAAVTLALCAVALTATNVRRVFFPPRWALTLPDDTIQDWRSYASGGVSVGSAEPRVTIVVFSDYQCPACRRLYLQIAQLRVRYPGALAVVWRQFPLQGHPFAALAARAAVCAEQQGRFEAMHALLFIKAESLQTFRWTGAALAAGVRDSTAFTECLDSRQAADAIERDVAAGRVLGVPGTPTILLDSLLFLGAPRDLSRLVRQQLRG